MAIFDKFRKKKRTIKNLSDAEIELCKMLGIVPNEHNLTHLNSTTYLACIKLISESIGKLPLQLNQYEDGKTSRDINNPKYNFLKIRPNPYMTPTLFWQQAVFNIYHYGNCYIYMKFKGYKLEGLYLLNPKHVTILIDNVSLLDNKCKIYYRYTDPQSGQLVVYPMDNIIHLKNSVLKSDGIVGMSIAELLGTQISNELESSNYMNNLISHNMSGKNVLQYVGDLDEKAEERLVQAIESFAKGERNTSGNILPLPLGFNLTSINTKLVDMEFLDIGKFTAQQIASAFGISSSYLNIRDGSTSYTNSEQETLRFLQTLQFPLQCIEDELTYKILSTSEVNKGMYFEFDINYLLRTDLKTQAEILDMYVKNGIYSINQAKDILGLPPVECGDESLVQGAMTTLSNIIKGVNYQQDIQDNNDENEEELGGEK